MNRSLYTILTFAKINTRRFFRDKTAIFFGILFPLIFLFVFGGIFGNQTTSFHIALINNSDSAFAKQFTESLKKTNSLKIDEMSKLDEARQKMVQSQIDAAVVLPQHFGEPDATTHLPSGKA